ncbi:hypothetical protein NL108_014402 [Boleophthalmus pectinirostris]|nr:hypothetical protein NL108_014402 [Boleophthalmus pectinirostris]
MASWAFRVFVLLLSVLLGSCGAKRDAVVYCSACSAMVEEMIFSIGQIDPKKTVNVGGFRLSPDGTIRDKKVTVETPDLTGAELTGGTALSEHALSPERRILKVFINRISVPGYRFSQYRILFINWSKKVWELYSYLNWFRPGLVLV